MPREARFEDEIRRLLKKAPNGLPAHEIVDKVGCSRQQAYKVLSKIARKSGRTNGTGGHYYVLDDGAEMQHVEVVGRRGGVLVLGDMLQVVAERLTDDGRHVIDLRGDNGKMVTVELEEERTELA